MKNIVIVGAGGMGREIFCYLQDAVKVGKNYSVSGFIDDNLNALDAYKNYPPLLSSISDFIPQESDRLIIAIADPQAKKKCVELLKSRGAKFENFSHPSCMIGINVKLGEGVVMAPFSSATCDCELGDFSFLNISASVGHNVKIGKFSTVSSHCDITGYASLGEGVFMASHSTVAPKVKIGNWAKVGINSAVISNVKDGASVFGTPAQKINF